MSEKITSGKVVGLTYTLKNDAGDTVDQSQPEQPFQYLHGHQNIVPGLEKQLDGLEVGTEKKIAVSPEEGYGAFDDQLVFRVPAANFPQEVELQPGMQFQSEGPQGAMVVTVTGVENDVVTVDGNHPLAGQVLHFDVKVDSVRDATDIELEHGHVH
ncbi:FKBP-type peptidyl prolyl cis-trans isomerase /apo-metallochaperone SlyD [Anseongella ginsenosidimutans]|uniref:Peptidyl-prolyl cis-trans isomerase n=1 Tax=Anseongella ginsenosidimutans TaxID=496056 RepID=A0A4R3KPD8_9SPHI|nr:peptidylprolyl isomerase [Anseongella ginsenosidimutans]TCS86538.1 FKBP-type peptidyl prolyl cis-trans isomerase /apo-metallochaperone SlyD [Anseongella ginsenosidimutans]